MFAMILHILPCHVFSSFDLAHFAMSILSFHLAHFSMSSFCHNERYCTCCHINFYFLFSSEHDDLVHFAGFQFKDFVINEATRFSCQSKCICGSLCRAAPPRLRLSCQRSCQALPKLAATRCSGLCNPLQQPRPRRHPLQQPRPRRHHRRAPTRTCSRTHGLLPTLKRRVGTSACFATGTRRKATSRGVSTESGQAQRAIPCLGRRTGTPFHWIQHL